MDTKKEFAFDFVQPAPMPARSQQQPPKQQSKSRSKASNSTADATTTAGTSTITVTPAQVETAAQMQQTQQEREQRIRKARALMQQQTGTDTGAAGADAGAMLACEGAGMYTTETGSGMGMGMSMDVETGAALTPVQWHDAEQMRSIAVQYDEDIKAEAMRLILEDGRSIISVCRQMHIDKNAVQAWIAETKKEIEERSEVRDLKQIGKIEEVTEQLLSSLDKTKLASASVRDIGVAYGILRDKLRDIRGPRQTGSSTSFRIAWQGGEGAVEIKTE